MSEGSLLYFTPAEYIVMMELAGSGTYSMLRGGGLEPDNPQLIQAFSSLFQREIIVRTGDRFVLSEKGFCFSNMKQARFAVLLSAAPVGFAAMCYVGEQTLYLAELADDILSWRYRLRQMDRSTIRDWLIDAAALQIPALRDEDAAELEQLLEDDLKKPSGSVLFRLERHMNGGPPLCAYELTAGRSGEFLVRKDTQGCTAKIYTEDALSQMLTECFGEDAK